MDDDIIGLVAVILLFGTPAIAIICGTLVALCRRKKPAAVDPQETKLIQEIHHGLSRMEQRIEALETIIFDQHKGTHP